MPKYKVTKVFLTGTDSKEEVVAKITAYQGELFKFVCGLESQLVRIVGRSGSLAWSPIDCRF
jgi:hypothetical protein